MTTPAVVNTWNRMTDEEHERFERDGYLIIRGALASDEVERYATAVDAVYERQRAADALAQDRSLHLLSAVTSCPELRGLIDHPKTFPLVWSTLGWNVHIYHSHLDVHPKVPSKRPFRWHWHQDGGRQNRELETDPRPRMSVKLAYWLSDVSQPGRGNLTLIPGSHRTNWLPGPPRRDVTWPTPAGAMQVTVEPGDAVFFDRRIWHARSDNLSGITRKCVFLGYTYRWVAVRDDVRDLPAQEWWADTNPVQRQLLGAMGTGAGQDGYVPGDDAWGHYPEGNALYVELRERGLLDPMYPPLVP